MSNFLWQKLQNLFTILITDSPFFSDTIGINSCNDIAVQKHSLYMTSIQLNTFCNTVGNTVTLGADKNMEIDLNLSIINIESQQDSFVGIKATIMQNDGHNESIQLTRGIRHWGRRITSNIIHLKIDESNAILLIQFQGEFFRKYYSILIGHDLYSSSA